MKDRDLFPALPIATLILLILVVAVFAGIGRAPATLTLTSQGVAYLERREKQDPAPVADSRQQADTAKLTAQRDRLLQQLRDGSLDPFSLFRDYVVMGDSRAVGFWYGDFLDKDRVLADGGHTVRNLREQMDALVEMAPKQIFLCYGFNDASGGHWTSEDAFVTEYIALVRQLRDRLPDAAIVVSSILPAMEPALERYPPCQDIPQWNTALKKACEQNGILYADCSTLALEQPELWDSDGIHFRDAFYPHWAGCLAKAIVMEGAQE